jgi:hypothetical protein
MEKEFVTIDLALRLKALGFKERVLTYYEDGKAKLHTDIEGWDFNNSFLTCVSRPTFSQAFRFFREKYGLFAEITLWGDGLGYTSMIKEIKQEEFIEIYQKCIVDTGLPIWVYEKAELACLTKLIELVESKTE